MVTEGILLALGNPLLDIQAKVDEDFLNKWDLKTNDAILCDEKRVPIFRDMVDKYKSDVEYIAGGSTQNTVRVCQWMLKEPKHACIYMGCIGRDSEGEILAKKAEEDGIKTVYQINDNVKTGTCAVCIVNVHRSLCANLSAAEKFTVDHVIANWPLVERAKFYYIAGFALTVCPPAIQKIAEHAAAENKLFSMNLSAPFLAKFFKEPMMAAMPYVDILFGNDDEMKTFAEEQNLTGKTMEEIGLQISKLPKKSNRSRMVVITQGTNPVVVVQDGKMRLFDVPLIAKDKIIDTNGAGDAFVGGFLSQFVQGRPLEKCVDAATWAAQQIIQRSGVTLPEKCLYA